ncbi:MAG: hypothetical protein COA45_03930 [Zetaproteobacteria bacterium]|nr:MAG: hypothetical protein COA45_03930 [Zetaproteobacteria bacterium]
MEDASFIDLLFSKQSIAGVWAVIGALIALIGVFGNNFWENSRKKKEREHELIRDAYYGAVEYINYYTNHILSIGNSGETKSENDNNIVSEKYYRLFLIASPEVIDTFTKLSLKYSVILMELGESSMDLQQCSLECASHQQEKDTSLNIMEQIVLDKKEYNEKSKNIPDLWDYYVERYNNAEQAFDSHGDKLDVARKHEFELKLKLIKESIEQVLKINSSTYDAIFMMRSDLDRKLNGKDSKKIKNSINILQEHFEEKLTAHIENLKLRIIKMEQDR